MPTYSVVRGVLPPDQGKKLGELLKIQGEVNVRDGSARLVHPEFLWWPTRAVADDTKDEAGRPTQALAVDFEKLAQSKPISPTQAQALLMNALRQSGTLMPGAKPVSGHTTLEWHNKNEPVRTVPIDTFVGLNFTLGTTPLVGPGAKVRIAVNPDGKTTQLRYAYRQLKQGTPVPVISPAEADRILIGLLKSKPETVARMTKRLVYYAPPIELQ